MLSLFKLHVADRTGDTHEIVDHVVLKEATSILNARDFVRIGRVVRLGEWENGSVVRDEDRARIADIGNEESAMFEECEEQCCTVIGAIDCGFGENEGLHGCACVANSGNGIVMNGGIFQEGGDKVARAEMRCYRGAVCCKNGMGGQWRREMIF